MDTSAPEKLSIMRVIHINKTKMLVLNQFAFKNFAYIVGYAY